MLTSSTGISVEQPLNVDPKGEFCMKSILRIQSLLQSDFTVGGLWAVSALGKSEFIWSVI